MDFVILFCKILFKLLCVVVKLKIEQLAEMVIFSSVFAKRDRVAKYIYKNTSI